MELFKLTEVLFPDWARPLRKLAVGALAMYRLRLSDMFMREQVFLLWIVEGNDFIRAHGGSCFMYHDDGAFQTYKGIPPESTFGRVKEYLLRLEGLFRVISKDTRRNDNCLLRAIENVRQTKTGLDDLFLAFEEAAIFNVGGRQRTRRFKGHGKGDRDDADDASDGPQPLESALIHWNVLVAEALSKVGLHLQKALLEEKIISFIVEWCETPIRKRPGVAYADACILYDHDKCPVRHVQRSPDNDIYLRIPHPLLDPVLESATNAYQVFISQTFWANLQVYRCMQAAIALVKRGENIDRCFIGISPGGVGQSLYSSLLDAMFGHLHAFFDPNIWYNDEEMRKQIGNLEGCVIMTAQEAPETNRKLREDLYKKTMSADGIAGRKPYGMVTRMLELVGWKRLEANRMLQFSGVTEHNFNSIYRRSLVWKPKARFLDGEYLKEHYPDHEKDGIFPKNPILKHMLVSGPTVAAGLRDQHGFEVAHTREQCREFIESYVTSGGDGGLTEDLLRAASGLPPRDRTTYNQPADAELSAIQVDTEEGPDDHQDRFLNVLDAVVNHALSHNRDVYTPTMFKYLTLPKDSPNLDKTTMWKTMLKDGLMTPVEVKGRKGVDFARPVIRTGKRFRRILPLAVPEGVNTFPELYDIQRLDKYLNGHPSRLVNARIIEEYMTENNKELKKPKKGKVSNAKKSEVEQLVSMCEKFKAGEALAYQFLAKHHAVSPNKKRRLQKKESDPQSQTSSEHRLVSVSMTYHYTLDDVIRTRRIADHVGAQSTTRRVLTQIVPHTKDLDIENCMFTIVDQLVDMIEIRMPADLRETLSMCAKERTKVCEELLNTDMSTGKELLSSVMSGAALSTPWDKNPFLQSLQKLARFMRWVACSLLPDVYNVCLGHDHRTFPEASTYSFMWSAVEDLILSSWLEFTLQHNVRHVSLHFDGIRLDADFSNGVADYCDKAQEHILSHTGFRIRIKEKTHLPFNESIAAKANESHVIQELDEVLEQPGNCIPCALFHLVPNAHNLLAKLKDDAGPDNVVAMNRRVRTYKDSQRLSGVALHPSLGFNVRTVGNYLIHSEGHGRPHCIAIKVTGTQANDAELFDGKQVWKISRQALQSCAGECVDKSTIVTFRVSPASGPRPQIPPQDFPGATDHLLQLQAGGRSVRARPAARDDDDSNHGHGLEREHILSDDPAPAEQEDEDEDEAIVKVGDKLLLTLQEEVAAALANKCTRKRKRSRKSAVCALCPFRAFNRLDQLNSHIRGHHTSKRQYVCSGTKQMRVIIALWDNDQLTGRDNTRYLERSAVLLADTIGPGFDSRQNSVDKRIRLVLTGSGPVYFSCKHVDDSTDCRRVGNVYYNREFAEVLKAEVLVHNCKIRSLLPRLAMIATGKGSELSSLFPTKQETWWGLVEDVFTSHAVKCLAKSYMDVMVQNEEMETLSIDATMKITMSIAGQAHWQADRATKESAAIREPDSIRRVLTVRGRTGAVLAMSSYKQGDGTEADRVCACLTAALPARARQVVRFISVDNASALLWESLKNIFPIWKCSAWTRCIWRSSTSMLRGKNAHQVRVCCASS